MRVATKKRNGRPRYLRSVPVHYQTGTTWINRHLLPDPNCLLHAYAFGVVVAMREQGIKVELLREPLNCLLAMSEDEIDAELAAGRRFFAIDFARKDYRLIAPDEPAAKAGELPSAVVIVDLGAIVTGIRRRLAEDGDE